MSAASNHRTRSISRTAAFAVAGLIMLVPANVLPVMHMQLLGGTPADTTIIAGVETLVNDGLWGLGAIVFAASILVPMLKLAGIARLLWAVRCGPRPLAPRLTRLYAVLDFIGRWSMLDVFLVAFLTGAVQLGRFALVEPREGIVAFALAVVFTMLATHSFDPHLLWSESPSHSSHGNNPQA